MLQNDRITRKLLLDRDPKEFRLMLFDLAWGGHYPSYIKHLVRYWCQHNLTGYLDIVVLPKFLEKHSDVVDEALGYETNNVNFVAITPQEVDSLSSFASGFSRARRSFQEWQLIYRYAEKLKSEHCLILFFDTRQYPLAIHTQLPCSFSSIYFRPTFHYDSFVDHVISWQERLQQWRERLIISRILQHQQLQTLFCLDPFVVKHLEQFNSKVKATFLPDPVYLYNNYQPKPEVLKKSLGIESTRQVFLLFGALEERKGIYQLLEALTFLTPDLAKKLCILIVGLIGANPQCKLKMEKYILKVNPSQAIQIIVEDRYILDQEIQSYFQMADVILAPYQRHVGMSGILVRAAAEQKPVLSSDYGLMGEITRRYELGLTVDSTIPEEIAKGLTKLLQKSPADFGDRSKMQRFAEQNTAEKFAATIFQNLSIGIKPDELSDRRASTSV